MEDKKQEDFDWNEAYKRWEDDVRKIHKTSTPREFPYNIIKCLNGRGNIRTNKNHCYPELNIKLT